MLPSTSLFKAISCPYFEAGVCHRPFCHFKHTKKDDKVPVEAAYVATPKSVLMAMELLPPPVTYSATPKRLLTGDSQQVVPDDNVVAKTKRPKLEYVPTMVKPSTENIVSVNLEKDAQRKRHSTDGSSSDAVYIPTKLHKISETERSARSNKTKENSSRSSSSKSSSDKSSSSKSAEKSDRHLDKHKVSSHKERSSKETSSRESKKQSSESTSQTSKDSPHKDKSEKSHSSRKSSSDDKRSDSRSNGHKKSTSEKSTEDNSKSDSRHRSSSKTSSSSSRHKSSGSSSDKKSSSSSKSSTISKSRQKTPPKPEPVVENNDDILASLSPSSLMYDSSDEDDIMAQCKMIFNEFVAEEVPATTQSTTLGPQPSEIFSDPSGVDASKRKRVAHENAPSYKPPMVAPATNHVQRAMQSVQARQEMVRKQMEEKRQELEKENAEKERLALEIKQQEKKEKDAKQKHAAMLDEKVRRQLEATLTSNGEEFKTLTPLIKNRTAHSSPSIARLGARSVAPVSNILAMQMAKKKIEELQAARRASILGTPAQTAPKTGKRVAHAVSAATAAAATNITKNPAPPVLEPNSTKISYNIRMQYYNLMVTQCAEIYPKFEDGWQRAQQEELVVLKKCATPAIYKSSAALAVNKLKKEAALANNGKKPQIIRTESHDVILAGKHGQAATCSVIPKTIKLSASGSAHILDNIHPEKAYNLVFGCCLTDEQLVANGYPRSRGVPGNAIINKTATVKPRKEDERYCSRCSKLFNLKSYEYSCVDECNYHPKSTGYRRGFADNSHRCCQQPAGTSGCMYANYHVSDYVDFTNLSGFVTTIERDEDYVPTLKDIFALDCEMCYTTHGLELTRITVVNWDCKTVYDTLVKPDNKIVDYNTMYSGITEEMMNKESRSIRDVQAILLSMFHSRTILVGHSLESDFKALKLIHSAVVDTSVLYPHKMGPPKKRALKTLCIENLKRIIQENEHGHDSAEDAEVCIQLIKHYLRNMTV